MDYSKIKSLAQSIMSDAQDLLDACESMDSEESGEGESSGDSMMGSSSSGSDRVKVAAAAIKQRLNGGK